MALDVRPGLSGGIDHGGGVNIDLALRPDPGNPTAFWQLLATSNFGATVTHQIQISNDSGKVKIRVAQADGLELEVV